jgi:methionyl-tRNA formyltransferase
LLNIHPSLLPEFRGASPIQAALATGKAVTGVSVIQMDSQMDHGPLVSQFKETILSEDTNESLRQRLFERSALFLEELIPHYISGKIKPKAQNHEAATFTKLLKREDGYIPGSILTSVLNGQSTEDIALRFVKDMAVPATASSVVHLHKAFSPWPGLYTKITLDGKHQPHLEQPQVLVQGRDE